MSEKTNTEQKANGIGPSVPYPGNTDGAHPLDVLRAINYCASHWADEARLLGNVRAADIQRATAAAITALGPQPTQRGEDGAAAWQSLLKSVVLSHDSADDFESLMALAVARRALGFKLVDDDEEVLLANGYDVQAELDAVFTPRGDGASR